MKVQPFKIFILCLSCCATAVSFAELRVYSGTIGQQPVLVELSFDDAQALSSGRYAYVKQGKIIQLEGVRGMEGKLEEQAWSSDEQIVSATWQLQAEGEQLLGLWQNSAGKMADIHLQRVKNQLKISTNDRFSPFDNVFGTLLAQQSPVLQLKRAAGRPQAGVATHYLLWQDKNLAIKGVQIVLSATIG